MDETRSNEPLAQWRLRRGVVEIAVVSLESTGIQHDYLEFHFTRPLSVSQKAELETIFPTLVRAWRGRKTGLVTQAQMDVRMIHARKLAADTKLSGDAPILGDSNPAKLSRSEFRLCLLLSRGLSVKGSADELGLTEATIRSHLRAIYSKTNCSGMSELLYRILSYRSETFGAVARHKS